MKKFSIALFALMILAIIYYLATNQKSMRTKTDFFNIKSEKPLNKKIKHHTKSISGAEEVLSAARPAHNLEPEELSEEEITEFEEYFEEVEKNWLTSIETLFIGEFSFDDSKLQTYIELREKYEEEKMIAFQEFHEFMVSKHGDNYTYNPTDEMEVFENQIAKIYLSKMRKLIGNENFKRYLEIKDEYNDRLRNEQDPDKGIILIEL